METAAPPRVARSECAQQAASKPRDERECARLLDAARMRAGPKILELSCDALAIIELKADDVVVKSPAGVGFHRIGTPPSDIEAIGAVLRIGA